MFTKLHFNCNLNGTNNLEHYIPISWKSLLGRNTLACWAYFKVQKRIRCCEYIPCVVSRILNFPYCLQIGTISYIKLERHARDKKSSLLMEVTKEIRCCEYVNAL
jgi:hypothetical protein